MTAFAARHWMPEEQTIAKIRSRLYPASTSRVSIFISTRSAVPTAAAETGWRWFFPVACMTPRSRGAFTLRSPDPLA